MNEKNLIFSQDNKGFNNTFEENYTNEAQININNSVYSLTENKKQSIFIIKKTRLGNKRNRNSNKKRKAHTKESSDNIISNIKNKILKNLLGFINDKIKKLKNSELMKLSLKYIDKKYIPFSNKKNKLCLLNMKLKNLFSKNISERYKKLAKQYSNYKKYNKMCISKIYQYKEIEIDSDLINLFESSFKDVIEIYNGKKEKSEYYEGFITLEEDIKNLEANENESYINSYKNVAENFVQYIENIKEKNSKKI